jgi:hypothetical protein
MKKLESVSLMCVCATALALVAPSIGAAEPAAKVKETPAAPPKAPKEGWESLFNGKDLTG